MQPTHCTSLSCDLDLKDEYCPSCSHGLYIIERKDSNGNVLKFEFSARFGVTFLDENDEQPEGQFEDDWPGWSVFQEWYDENFK